MVAGRNGCQAEAVRDVRRQVLQTVDGQVDGAVQEALFQFCREQTFAADAGQRDIEDFVALRDDVLELDTGAPGDDKITAMLEMEFELTYTGEA